MMQTGRMPRGSIWLVPASKYIMLTKPEDCCRASIFVGVPEYSLTCARCETASVFHLSEEQAIQETWLSPALLLPRRGFLPCNSAVCLPFTCFFLTYYVPLICLFRLLHSAFGVAFVYLWVSLQSPFIQNQLVRLSAEQGIPTLALMISPKTLAYNTAAD